MKQVIVLVCSILLGIILVNMIIGSDGIGTHATNILQDEYVFRSSEFQKSDKDL